MDLSPISIVSSKNNSERWGITEHQTITVTFKWVIKKFSFCTKKCGEFIHSPTFSPDNHEQLVWNLQLYPKGQDQESKDFLSIYLNLVPRNSSEVHAKYQFAVVNSRGELCEVINGNRHCFSKESLGWGRRKFVEQQTLFDDKNGLLPNDTLTIHCKVEIAAETTESSCQSTKMLPTINPTCQLVEDLGHLFECNSFTDVVFSITGVEFRAHKAILTARCPVFAAMFHHEMQESRTNKVVIKDVDPQIFREILRFVYTGKVNHLEDMAEELLITSEKYGLQDLKNMCQIQLWSQLSIENSVKLLILADIHSAHQLKEAAINFINRNTKDVVKTADWKALEKSHPHLFVDLYIKGFLH